ncbi:hypothetical protein BGX23_004406 [Mortierella sp. AD031]|nr:hypothetical protein BGX23_004406 [Mortierella sp. AD031]
MSVSSVAVSPDGLQIASGSRDETVRLWKLKTGEVEYVLKGHAEAVAVAYSPDGRQLASGGREGTVRIWNTRTGETERVLERESYGGVNSVAFSSDGRRMASAHNGGQIQLWNAETRQPGRLLIGHAKSVMGVTFSPNNQWIASAGWDFTVRLWDSETGVLCNILLGHTLFVSSVSFSPTSPQFTSCSRDKTVRIWELQDLYTSGPSLGVQDLTEPLPLVRYSPTGQHVVSANREGEIYRWDPLAFDPQLLWRIVEQYEISSMAYSPKGLQIASAVNSPNDFSVRLWDSATGETGLVLTGHQDRVAFLSYSPCDRWIASASDDETVCIWDTQAAADNALVHTFKSHACGVGFSPDGRQIAYGGFNKKLWVRDASSGQLVATLRGHSELISTVDYSPDGALLASGSWDNTVRLWDTATHKPVVVLRGHSNWVLCLAFSSCGKWIASGSRDMTLRLWDVKSSLLGGSESEQTVQSSSCVSVVQPFAAFVTHVAWNPNGAMEFVTSTAVHSIQGWKMVMSHKDENRQGAGADDVDVVSVGLDWSSESNSLVGFGAKTAEAKGLNVFDRALLQQCETVEEFKLQGIDELDE